jgi:hypothetical protein
MLTFLPSGRADRRNKWFFHPLFKKTTKIILANKEILFPVVGQSPEMHAWSTTTCVFFQRLSHMFVVPRTGLNQGTPTEASHFTAWLLSTEESRLACGLKKISVTPLFPPPSDLFLSPLSSMAPMQHGIVDKKEYGLHLCTAA